jgi:peptidase E
MLEPMSIGRPVIIPDLQTLDGMRHPFASFTFESENPHSLQASLRALSLMSDQDLSALGESYYHYQSDKFSGQSSVLENLYTIEKITQLSTPGIGETQMKIVAIGGGEIGRPGFPVQTMEIDQEIIALSEKEKPNLLFVGTALGDDELYLSTVEKHFGGTLGCTVKGLKLCSPGDHSEEMREALNWADIVYVGAGNTGAMLARWRELGFDILLKEAAQQGKVLSGLSAGGVCWFENGASMPTPERMEFISGLNLVPSTMCPHFDTQPARRIFARQIVEEKGGSVIGLAEGCALIFSHGQYKIISSQPNAECTLISLQQGEVQDTLLRQNIYSDTLEGLCPTSKIAPIPIKRVGIGP